MKKIFLVIRGFLASLLERRTKAPSELKRHTYFCYPVDNSMGIVMQQPDLCNVQKISISSRREEEVEIFLDCFYRFLQGINSINIFTNRYVDIVIPYYYYYLIMMNLPYWHKKYPNILNGIFAQTAMLSGNFVDVRPSSSKKPGLKSAREIISKRNRIE